MMHSSRQNCIKIENMIYLINTYSAKMLQLGEYVK